MPAVVWGYFPVNADGDDLVVWTDDDRRTERLRFTFPRQQQATASSASPTSSAASSRGEADYAGVPRRHGRREATRQRERELFAADRYQEYLLVPRPVGRDDRGARRALAPPHPRGVGLRRRGRPDARRACSASSTAARGTRGATRRAPTSRTRPSSTTCSSCDRIGVKLTEEFQLEPEQSTSAIIVPHPEAKYFIV